MEWQSNLRQPVDDDYMRVGIVLANRYDAGRTDFLKNIVRKSRVLYFDL